MRVVPILFNKELKCTKKLDEKHHARNPHKYRSFENFENRFEMPKISTVRGYIYYGPEKVLLLSHFGRKRVREGGFFGVFFLARACLWYNFIAKSKSRVFRAFFFLFVMLLLHQHTSAPPFGTSLALASLAPPLLPPLHLLFLTKRRHTIDTPTSVVFARLVGFLQKPAVEKAARLFKKRRQRQSASACVIGMFDC